jgi:hypothetical protein
MNPFTALKNFLPFHFTSLFILLLLFFYLSYQPFTSLHFMKPGRSLPRSQQPVTCPYPEPDKFSPRPHPISLRSILPSMLSSCKWFLSFRNPHQNPVHTSTLSHSAKCPVHLIFLDFIKRIVVRSTSHEAAHSAVFSSPPVRLRLKCDGTRAETRFCLSAKRASLFKSAGASVQSTTGRRAVHISLQGLYCSCKPVFCSHVTLAGYPLHSLVCPSILLPCVTVCHHISTGLYLLPTGPKCLPQH